MSRATLAQLKLLGIDSYALNQQPDASLQAALDAASARIDSALGTQFTLPIVAPYPMDIIECECVIASWTALMVLGYNPGTGNTDTNIKERYLQWMEYLNKVSKGELVPNVVDSGTSGSASYGASGPTVITATSRGYSERGQPQQSFPVTPTNPYSSD